VSETIVQLTNLTKSYPGFNAVDNLNLTVNQGEIVGFLGPNGAGKSTTLRMMLSLITPTSGQITMFGKDIKQERYAILRRVGCIIEKPDFYLYLSAQRNLEIFAQMNGIRPSRARYDEMIELVGLSGRASDKVATYSHGMKQRLGLAQALIHNPDLVILDEPTTGLDPQGIIDLRNLILQLKNEMGKTVILSSHILSEVQLIADSMTIINKGKVVVQGKVATLLSREALIVWIEPVDVAQAISVINQSRWQQYYKGEVNGKLQLDLGQAQIAELNTYLISHGVSIYSVQYRGALEDYFLQLTQA
jgi:ABC-type multidrug transport system ATPase subunit